MTSFVTSLEQGDQVVTLDGDVLSSLQLSEVATVDSKIPPESNMVTIGGATALCCRLSALLLPTGWSQ